MHVTPPLEALLKGERGSFGQVRLPCLGWHKWESARIRAQRLAVPWLPAPKHVGLLFSVSGTAACQCTVQAADQGKVYSLY